MKVVLPQINFIGSCVATNVTYSATLPFSQDGVLFVSGLLRAERLRRGTRTGSRALGCFKQAVMILRWFLDGTRVAQLAADNTIGRSTAYSYLHEGIDVLAAKAPGLHGALLAAKAAGCDHVIVDGTLIATDRCRTRAPHPGWTCGGRASTPITAATSKRSPPRTGGRCGPPRYARVASTTPRRCVPTRRSCPR